MPKEQYQPSPEEVQKAEGMMSEGQKKGSLERERVHEEGAETSLLRYARELNYDDRCGGDAVRAFREQLKLLAEHIRELESAGFQVRVNCTPVSMGGASVYIERGGESMRIYSQFYDTFSRGFNDTGWYGSVGDIKETIEKVMGVAKLFQGERKE